MATKRKVKRSGKVNRHLPFVIYIRVSRIGGRSATDGFISKVLQLQACKQVANAEGVEVYGVLREQNLSGTSLERPKFQEALQLIRDGVCGGIIVMTLDRFSRDTADGLTLIKDIEAHGGTVLCGDGPVSCRTPDAELQTTARLMVATREVGGKKEAWARSVEHALKGGRHLAIPYGYMRGTYKGRARVLVAHPDEAPVVKRMFQLRADGYGWNAIAKVLNEDGILPRTYRRPLKDADGDYTDEWQVIQGAWRGAAVRGIIKSRTYLGHAWEGDHEFLHAHQPLVTQRLHDAANYSTTSYTGVKQNHMLSGLVRCANCGYAMVHAPRGDRRYYVCRGRNAAHQCTAPASVPADQLEAFMEDAALQAGAQLAKVKPVKDDSTVAAAEAAFQDAQSAYLAAQDRLDRLPRDASKTQRKLVQQNHDDKLAALTQAEAAYDKARLSSRAIRLPIKLSDLPRLWPTMPVAEKRHLLSALFACVVVRPAQAWREVAAERSLVVPVNAVPGSSSIIEFVVSLGFDGDPARTGVEAF